MKEQRGTLKQAREQAAYIVKKKAPKLSAEFNKIEKVEPVNHGLSFDTVYAILEDNNYHSENSIITCINAGRNLDALMVMRIDNSMLSHQGRNAVYYLTYINKLINMKGHKFDKTDMTNMKQALEFCDKYKVKTPTVEKIRKIVNGHKGVDRSVSVSSKKYKANSVTLKETIDTVKKYSVSTINKLMTGKVAPSLHQSRAVGKEISNDKWKTLSSEEKYEQGRKAAKSIYNLHGLSQMKKIARYKAQNSYEKGKIDEAKSIIFQSTSSRDIYQKDFPKSLKWKGYVSIEFIKPFNSNGKKFERGDWIVADVFSGDEKNFPSAFYYAGKNHNPIPKGYVKVIANLTGLPEKNGVVGSMAVGSNAGRQYYIPWSSWFDVPPYYDRKTILESVKKAGGLNAHLEPQFGWSNQPDIVVFTTLNDNEAEKILKEVEKHYKTVHPERGTPWMSVSKKNWRGRKAASKGRDFYVDELKKKAAVGKSVGKLPGTIKEMTKGFEDAQQSLKIHSFTATELQKILRKVPTTLYERGKWLAFYKFYHKDEPKKTFYEEERERKSTVGKSVGRSITRLKVGSKFVYNPKGHDIWDPKVIEGYPIKNGSIVTVTKSDIDPFGVFVFVKDESGNKQNIGRGSLIPITREYANVGKTVTGQKLYPFALTTTIRAYPLLTVRSGRVWTIGVSPKAKQQLAKFKKEVIDRAFLPNLIYSQPNMVGVRGAELYVEPEVKSKKTGRWIPSWKKNVGVEITMDDLNFSAKDLDYLKKIKEVIAEYDRLDVNKDFDKKYICAGTIQNTRGFLQNKPTYLEKMKPHFRHYLLNVQNSLRQIKEAEAKKHIGGRVGKRVLTNITQKEWEMKKKHRYTSIIKGQKYILTQDATGTCLLPVKIISSATKRKPVGDGEYASVYTTKQAIEDGELIPISETSKLPKEAGFKAPVLITRGVMEILKVPEGVSAQDFDGRLWDLLSMARYQVRRMIKDNDAFGKFSCKFHLKEGMRLKDFFITFSRAEGHFTIMKPGEY